MNPEEVSIEGLHAGDIRNEILMGKHNSLGHACGTRGVGEGIKGITCNLIKLDLSKLCTIS